MVGMGAPPLLLGVGASVLGDRLAELCWVPGSVWSVPGPPMLLAVGLGLVGTFAFIQNKQLPPIRFLTRISMPKI